MVVPDVAGWRQERMPKFLDVACCAVPPFKAITFELGDLWYAPE